MLHPWIFKAHTKSELISLTLWAIYTLEFTVALIEVILVILHFDASRPQRASRNSETDRNKFRKIVSQTTAVCPEFIWTVTAAQWAVYTRPSHKPLHGDTVKRCRVMHNSVKVKPSSKLYYSAYLIAYKLSCKATPYGRTHTSSLLCIHAPYGCVIDTTEM